MTRKDTFVLLVQTAAIVESLTLNPWPHTHLSRSEMARIAVNAALSVLERDLPNDLGIACTEHIAYVFAEGNPIPKPLWLHGIL